MIDTGSFLTRSPRQRREKWKYIYIVTSGDYSDYGVAAVFSTKEKAQEFCKLHNINKEDGEDVCNADGSYRYTPDYRVETWEVDAVFPEVPKDQYGFYVFMSKDGETSVVRRRSIAEALASKNKVSFYGPPTPYPDGSVTSRKRFWANVPEEKEVEALLNNTEFMVLNGVLARDEQHALKIANEKRAQLLALQRWPTEYDNHGYAVGNPMPLNEDDA